MDYDDNLNIQNDDGEEDDDYALVQNLKTRFHREVIYTFTGKLLIAINPMKKIDFKTYSEKTMTAYRLQHKRSMPPHIYSIGTDAINASNEHSKPQCVVITGESGSGKTVAAHHLTQFICNTSPNHEYIMQHASNTMKLLDIFGNAETPENRNSSRFIKFLQIKRNSQNEVTDIHISYQLLEISRLCGETTFGFNFHVFYLLVFQAPINLRESLGLREQYFRVLPTKNSNLPCQYSFDELDQSLNHIGLVENVKHRVYQVLAAILHLLNLEFGEDLAQRAAVLNDAHLNDGARLLKLDSAELKHALTNRKFKTNVENSSISMPLNRSDAIRSRDSMVKSIYKQLFQFLVNAMNKANPESLAQNSIAILDIAGFECHSEGKNSFEQICINFVNETIQQYCIRKLIKDELEWYSIDGINFPELKFLDNENILHLFEHKTDGIWSLLEDESKKRSPSNDLFFQNIQAKCSKNSSFILPKLSTEKNSFIIKHFAKDVSYSSVNFVEKNTQRTSQETFDIIKNSLADFFDVDMQVNDSKSVTCSMRNDLGKLMKKLNEMDSHFIRCIKPNNNGDIGFDDNIVRAQLKANSIGPYINLMRKGYPTRISYQSLLPIFNEFSSDNANQRDLAEYLLSAVGYTKIDFKLGDAYIFFRPDKSYLLQQYEMSDTAVIKDLASKIRSQMRIETERREAEAKASEKKRMSEEMLNDQLQLHKEDELPTSNEGETASACSISEEEQERNDGKKHMPYHDDKKSGSRCKFPKCKQLTHVYCNRCQKHLCFTKKRNCFAAYHDLGHVE